jgi:hypothetical protein
VFVGSLLSSSALARGSIGGLLPVGAVLLAVAGTSGVELAAGGVVAEAVVVVTGPVSSALSGHPANAAAANNAKALVERLSFTCKLLADFVMRRLPRRSYLTGAYPSRGHDARKLAAKCRASTGQSSSASRSSKYTGQ